MTVNVPDGKVSINYQDIDIIIIGCRAGTVTMDDGMQFRVIDITLGDGHNNWNIEVFGKTNAEGGEPINVVVVGEAKEGRFDL